MIKDMIDKHELELDCPQCRQQNKATVGKLRAQGHFTCRGCGERVAVNTSDLDRTVRDLDAQLKRMGFR